MSPIRLSLALLSTVLLATGCGGTEAQPIEQGPAPVLESSGDTEGDVQAFNACTVTLACPGGRSISCGSLLGNCQSTATSVTCDGVTRTCAPTSCAPARKSITENISVCYPSSHPYGRYSILSPESGVTYTWSSNYASLHNNTGSYIVLSATSVGYFTLYVTASRPGCAQTTTFSADFYAADAASCY
ncbi:hypothetical protein [Myxococcus vastator]|uniref:hypothetical protein n=1 Tax=Myxococcus vastator TaxID=2709664 RepID=UPI0013D38F8B|nr:hypothetical protein [Myxococcus vastator]